MKEKKHKVSLLLDEIMILYEEMDYWNPYDLYQEDDRDFPIEFSDEMLFFKDLFYHRTEAFVYEVKEKKFYPHLTPFTDRRVQFQNLGDYLANDDILFNTETCPCCGFLTLEDRGMMDLCYICWWEDDGQDDHNADICLGGPNFTYTLSESRANFENYGTMYDIVKHRYHFWLNVRKNKQKLSIISDFYDVLENPESYNQAHFNDLESKLNALNSIEFELQEDKKIKIEFSHKELLLFKKIVTFMILGERYKSKFLKDLDLRLASLIGK